MRKYLMLDPVTKKVLQKICLPRDAAIEDQPQAFQYVEVSDEQFAKAVYFDGTSVQEIPPQPTQFHVWDDATTAWVPKLARAKVVRVREAVEEYRARKETPLAYDAKTLDTDDEAREQLMFKAFEFAERARLNQPAGAASRVWENADNTFFTFDTDQQFRNWLGGFVITLSNRTAQQRIILRQHVQNIRALTTVEDILAYDITVGWPS